MTTPPARPASRPAPRRTSTKSSEELTMLPEESATSPDAPPPRPSRRPTRVEVSVEKTTEEDVEIHDEQVDATISETSTVSQKVIYPEIEAPVGVSATAPPSDESVAIAQKIAQAVDPNPPTSVETVESTQKEETVTQTFDHDNDTKTEYEVAEVTKEKSANSGSDRTDNHSVDEITPSETRSATTHFEKPDKEEDSGAEPSCIDTGDSSTADTKTNVGPSEGYDRIGENISELGPEKTADPTSLSAELDSDSENTEKQPRLEDSVEKTHKVQISQHKRDPELKGVDYSRATSNDSRSTASVDISSASANENDIASKSELVDGPNDNSLHKFSERPKRNAKNPPAEDIGPQDSTSHTVSSSPSMVEEGSLASQVRSVAGGPSEDSSEKAESAISEGLTKSAHTASKESLKAPSTDSSGPQDTKDEKAPSSGSDLRHRESETNSIAATTTDESSEHRSLGLAALQTEAKEAKESKENKKDIRATETEGAAETKEAKETTEVNKEKEATEVNKDKEDLKAPKSAETNEIKGAREIGKKPPPRPSGRPIKPLLGPANDVESNVSHRESRKPPPKPANRPRLTSQFEQAARDAEEDGKSTAAPRTSGRIAGLQSSLFADLSSVLSRGPPGRPRPPKPRASLSSEEQIAPEAGATQSADGVRMDGADVQLKAMPSHHRSRGRVTHPSRGSRRLPDGAKVKFTVSSALLYSIPGPSESKSAEVTSDSNSEPSSSNPGRLSGGSLGEMDGKTASGIQCSDLSKAVRDALVQPQEYEVAEKVSDLVSDPTVEKPLSAERPSDTEKIASEKTNTESIQPAKTGTHNVQKEPNTEDTELPVLSKLLDRPLGTEKRDADESKKANSGGPSHWHVDDAHEMIERSSQTNRVSSMEDITQLGLPNTLEGLLDKPISPQTIAMQKRTSIGELASLESPLATRNLDADDGPKGTVPSNSRGGSDSIHDEKCLTDSVSVPSKAATVQDSQPPTRPTNRPVSKVSHSRHEASSDD